VIPVCEKVFGLAHEMVGDVRNLLDDSQGAESSLDIVDGADWRRY
jgi:hypothetical protein